VRDPNKRNQIFDWMIEAIAGLMMSAVRRLCPQHRKYGRLREID
jgi:hypothetical protein